MSTNLLVVEMNLEESKERRGLELGEEWVKVSVRCCVNRFEIARAVTNLPRYVSSATELAVKRIWDKEREQVGAFKSGE